MTAVIKYCAYVLRISVLSDKRKFLDNGDDSEQRYFAGFNTLQEKQILASVVEISEKMRGYTRFSF